MIVDALVYLLDIVYVVLESGITPMLEKKVRVVDQVNKSTLYYKFS